MSLANDGTGTFTGTHALPDGTYDYVFRTHGSADNLVKDGQFLLDQENPAFAVHPDAGLTGNRAVSSVSVPQMPSPLYHVKGQVLMNGQPQPCYLIDLEVGELMMGIHVLAEHSTANFAESGIDRTFDFPVAVGPQMVVIQYPFLLTGAHAAYPDPTKTPSIGYAKAGFTSSGDLTLDPAEVSYNDYALMAPTTADATLPVTFQFSVIAGSQSVQPSLAQANGAGNDPAWRPPPSTGTSQPFDGTLNNGNMIPLNSQYWWGTWQQRGATWYEESLLFPITFH